MNPHENLRYNFFVNKTRRMFHVVPEGKTGGPNSFIFGDFSLKADDERTYAQYKPELLAALEVAINTLQDIEPTAPVVTDPIEPDLPVPVSGEIRAKAYGLTGQEDGE